MSPIQAKQNLRREMLARLRAIHPADHARASLQICRTAASLAAFRTARSIAVFAPLPSEPDITPLIEAAWTEKKRVAFPFLVKGGPPPELQWYAVSEWDELISCGKLREPDPSRCPRLNSTELDCVFVPGLAFDSMGNRLGRGGGYYDSFLAQLLPTQATIGLFFAAQQRDSLPYEAHDRPLSLVLTEASLSRYSHLPAATSRRELKVAKWLMASALHGTIASATPLKHKSHKGIKKPATPS